MKNENKKCSSQKHKDLDAISYCQECHLNLCKKCENLHAELFQIHKTYNLDKNINEIFTGFCNEENHLEKLNFYCKDHDKLCCASCLCKIKEKNYGQHAECKVCFIEEIKEDKKNEIEDNIKILEYFSKRMIKTIEQINIIYDKLDENKEKLKLEIQTIFTKIRNVLNEREDKLLLELDNKFNEIYFKQDLPKKSKKLLNEINILINKGMLIYCKWRDEKLNLMIHDCIQFEDKVLNIYSVNETFKISDKLKNFQIKFMQEEENNINSILDMIKNFGNFNEINFLFIESNIIDNDDFVKYIINWVNPNKISKTKLLYSLSRNGDKIYKFHKLCNNKGNTLTLFHIEDGNKVGIYTNISWDCNSDYKKDNETFLFNLNKNKKFTNKKNKKLRGFCPDYGPFVEDFGCKTSMDRISYCYNSINSYFEDTYDLLPVKYGNENYYITYNLEEVEVFEINFEN